MRAELHGRLWANYPRVFTLRTEGPRRSNMSFGCECGDGWFGIVDRLCWCLRALWKLLRVNTQATQVKEKYGELRFYCTIHTPRSMPHCLRRWIGTLVCWLTDRAECESNRTCEACGAPGRLMRRGYWYATLCERCAPEGYERV